MGVTYERASVRLAGSCSNRVLVVAVAIGLSGCALSPLTRSTSQDSGGSAGESGADNAGSTGQSDSQQTSGGRSSGSDDSDGAGSGGIERAEPSGAGSAAAPEAHAGEDGRGGPGGAGGGRTSGSGGERTSAGAGEEPTSGGAGEEQAPGGAGEEPRSGGAGGDHTLGSGGATSSGGSGGATSSGGSGGGTSSGGSGGATSSGGSGGTTSSGGSGGTTSSGGSGGTAVQGGTGGPTDTGGSGGATHAGGSGGMEPPTGGTEAGGTAGQGGEPSDAGAGAGPTGGANLGGSGGTAGGGQTGGGSSGGASGGNGDPCEDHDECLSGYCNPAKICEPLECHDGFTNGLETDVDCGGSCVAKCGYNMSCKINEDCVSNACGAGYLCAATCSDGIVDGAETDVDCGGTTSGCSPCVGDQTCAGGTDCSSGSCVDSECVPRLTNVAAGTEHACALFDNGRIKCWGHNDFGQLGLGDREDRGDGLDEMGAKLPYVSLGTGRRAKAVTAGQSHTCALLDDGEVKCWGHNEHGELGLGNGWDHGDDEGEMGNNLLPVSLGAGRTATAVSAGSAHTCALLDDQQIKCWGFNYYGQLGLGNTDSHGHAADTMGDALLEVELGEGRTVKAVSAGGLHTCALLDNGEVKCWGFNDWGRLGLGDTTSRGGGADQMGDFLPRVELGAGRSAKAIVSGSAHTCALLDNDQIKCWGWNQYGQLGLGDGGDLDTHCHGDAANEMGDDLPTVALGTSRTAVAVSARGPATCALLDNAQVKCWGSNTGGALGLGLSQDANRGTSPTHMGDNLPFLDLGDDVYAKSISCGMNFACALLDTGELKCWGDGNWGQLGLGRQDTLGDASGEMGEDLPALVFFDD
ncbi:MAG: hypothetical protein JW940_11020 [Polyangiaceae bacterium]|nr:hypothetical protein [Polyangiaceae bacterium]